MCWIIILSSVCILDVLAKNRLTVEFEFLKLFVDSLAGFITLYVQIPRSYHHCGFELYFNVKMMSPGFIFLINIVLANCDLL